jgi:alkylation response protein AidB-like acyl-CoA dehydrogenase
MQFGLNDNQVMLRDSAREFFAGECPPATVRRVMDTDTAHDAVLWSQLAAQGYTGILFDETYGGIGLGVVELVLLMEEAGRALLPGPLFSTVALAGAVIDACGGDEQKARLLPPIARGDVCATLALLESSASWDPASMQLTATDGRLSGEKLFVTDAAVAETLLVVARDGVYVVDGTGAGVSIQPMSGMDQTRRLYVVGLQDVAAERLMNTAGLARGLQIAATALAAEMVGGMQRTLDITVEYAKTRKQFGKPIGQFQAVQHQCADMYLETESARSAVYYAAWALQERAADAAQAVAIAKLYASDVARHVGNRGIQVHGGMGFTWENDLHLYYRRAKASETMLGDATFHRELLARLVIDAARFIEGPDLPITNALAVAVDRIDL